MSTHETELKLQAIPIEKEDDINIILGQAHFIKTVEDLYEAMMNSVPGAKFGLAFCEASVKRLVRLAGTDETLIDFAKRNALAIGAGHSFIIMMRGCFPINVLNAIKAVPEVCTLFCATANPTTVIVAGSGEARGIIGVMDGKVPVGVEGEEDAKDRKQVVRRFGYKMQE
jgi:adenosine/AMP kinase